MESLCQSDFSNDVVSSLGGRAYGVGESAHIEPRAVVFAHSAWTIRRPTDRSGPASSIFCASRIFYSRLKVGMIFSSCVTTMMAVWYCPAIEEAFFDTPVYREFAGLDEFSRMPDGRHPLLET